MATISNTPRPGYIWDATDNCWYPIGVGPHIHSDISPGTTITTSSGTTVPLTIQNNGTGNSFVVNDLASDTTPFVINSDGQVGIGVTSPGYRLHNFHSTNAGIGIEGNSNVSLSLYRSSTDGNAGSINFRKARGSTGTRTTVSTDDNLGVIQFSGYDGAASTLSSAVYGYSEGSVSSGVVPGRLVFNTSDSSGTSVERMRIDSAGNIGVGKTATTKLDVEGTVNATAFTVGGAALASGGITLIASSAPTGTNTITFSSIPSTYQNLQLMFYGVKSTTGDELKVQVNGITGANCYSYSRLSNSTGAFAQGTFMPIGDTAGAANIRSGNAIFWNYSNATASGKEMSYWSNRMSVGAGFGLADFGHGMMVGTSASGYQGVGTISSITIFQTNNFQAGTNFALYGVK
jgi:hypothetical protein